MLIGRHNTAARTSHWTNRSWHCQAPCCFQVDETLEHILVFCPYYTGTRQKLVKLWPSSNDSNVKLLALSVLAEPPEDLVGFLLDASNHPLTIDMIGNYGPDVLNIIFHLTRTWCFFINRERLKLLKIFSFDQGLPSTTLYRHPCRIIPAVVYCICLCWKILIWLLTD